MDNKFTLSSEKLESRRLCSVTRDLLYVRVRFSDQANAPETIETSNFIVNKTATAIRDFSGGQVNLSTTIRDVTLPYRASYYGTNTYTISNHAQNILRQSGLNLNNYEHSNFRYNSRAGFFVGLGEVGGKITWTKDSDPGTLIHEIGHNLGLRHSSFVNPNNNAHPFGPGRTFEYGDVFSNMGNARYTDWNATQKWALGYISNNSVRAVNANSFNIVVSSHDNAAFYNKSEVYLVNIPIGGNNSIYASYRRDAGGVVIHVGNSFRPTGDTLIDGNPQTELSTDAALKLGQSITNFRRPGVSDDIRITVTSIVGNRATINVNFGAVVPKIAHNANLIAAFASMANEPVERCKIRYPVRL